jgi:hypothetical protein
VISIGSMQDFCRRQDRLGDALRTYVWKTSSDTLQSFYSKDFKASGREFLIDDGRVLRRNQEVVRIRIQPPMKTRRARNASRHLMAVRREAMSRHGMFDMPFYDHCLFLSASYVLKMMRPWRCLIVGNAAPDSEEQNEVHISESTKETWTLLHSWLLGGRWRGSQGNKSMPLWCLDCKCLRWGERE